MNRLNRRRFIASSGAVLASAASAGLFPAWARSGSAGIAAGEVLTGETIALTIGESHFATGGRSSHATPAIRTTATAKARAAIHRVRDRGGGSGGATGSSELTEPGYPDRPRAGSRGPVSGPPGGPPSRFSEVSVWV